MYSESMADLFIVFGPTFAVVVAAADGRSHLGNSACYYIRLDGRHGGHLRDDRHDGYYNLDCPCRHDGCNACRHPSSYQNADYIVAKILVAAA